MTGSPMPDGCTIGAKRIGKKVYLFKNRDLVYPDFKSTVTFDDDVFAVTGIDIAAGVPSGVSIGVNVHGLAVCSATVLIGTGSAYDPLLGEILVKATDMKSAYDIVGSRLESGQRYQWCNIVVATRDEVGAIEIGAGASSLDSNKEIVVRTNHHVRLDTTNAVKRAGPEEREAAGPYHTSQQRRQIATHLFTSASTLADITAILGTHTPGHGFNSICRHRDGDSLGLPFLGETSYSYVIEVMHGPRDPPDICFYVTRGNPCSVPYSLFQVDFGMDLEQRMQLVRSFP